MSKLLELQSIISRMPLQECCAFVLPEIGVRYRDVSRAVRNARLPLTSSSVALVLRKHAASVLPPEDIEHIVASLRLKLEATRDRVWHAIALTERFVEEPPNMLSDVLPDRLEQALQRDKRFNTKKMIIQTMNIGDLIFASLKAVSMRKNSSTLFVAIAPGESVAFTSSLAPRNLLKLCAEALGFKSYEDANLFGRDIHSLLRMYNESYDNPNILNEIPEYQPMPTITSNGIDYTYGAYKEQYVDAILGPNPPHLTDLSIKLSNPYHDEEFSKKNIKMNVNFKSQDVAKSLKDFVRLGVISPDSGLLKVFHEIRANKIVYENED